MTGTDFSIRTRTERLGKHGLTSETCKGAPNPERGDGAEIKGQGKPEATGPVVEGPYKGKNRRDGRKPTQCTGSGPRREDRRKKYGNIANGERTNVHLPQTDERNVITTQENQSGLKLKSHKHSSVDTQSDATPLRNRTIERREPPKSPRRARGDGESEQVDIKWKPGAEGDVDPEEETTSWLRLAGWEDHVEIAPT